VLPDLLSRLIDPVEQCTMQELDERSPRRSLRAISPNVHKKLTVTQGTSIAPVVVEQAQSGVSNGLRSVEPAEHVSSLETLMKPVEEAPSPPRTTRKPLKALAMRAERNGGPLPRLPAGQRWKRRLPKACW
jgi:hypothetical protein